MYVRSKDFHDNITPVQSTASPDPLRQLFHENGEALSNAAALLAGSRGAALVASIIEALQQPGRIGRGVRTALGRLLDILSLEHVDDPSRPEAGYFAGIDPWDPVVEEICMLTDGLRDAIAHSEATSEQTPLPSVLRKSA